MSNPVDGETLWRAFKESGYPDILYPGVRIAIQPFITAIPQMLSGLLDKLFTLKSLSMSTLAIGTYCLENDIFGKMYRVSALAVGATAEQVKTEVALATGELAVYLDKFALSIPALVDTDDVESGAIVKQMLNPENLERYRAGALTIGDVLATEPTLFCLAVWHFLIRTNEEDDEEIGDEDEYEIELEDDESDDDDGDDDDYDDFDDDDGKKDPKPPRDN